MKLERIKPYKAKKPEDTISLVRNILHNKLGILTKESNYIGESNFYSCRINIANFSLDELNIGTNGKGMNPEYSLASAYGEFMERLQNQMLILHRRLNGITRSNNYVNTDLYNTIKQNNLSLKYSFAPDEKNIIFSKKMDYIRKYIKVANIGEMESYWEGKPITLLPFFNIKNKRVEYLPHNLIIANCTSNGMCAGNTPKEALIQGMSEILERYVIRKIYFENLSLPTIAFDTFKGTIIYDKIKAITEKYKWDFQIKDCSCGLGIPAIGILIIDKVNMRYKFHIGVDPSPITALERTLTEIYQGRFVLDLKGIDWEVQNNLLSDFNLKDMEMFNTCTTGSGHYPISLLFGDESYQFTGFDLKWGESDDNDFKKMLNLFESLKTTVFIRDVSFLGFPAYHVYVPGLSEFRNIVSNNDMKGIDVLRNIYVASRNLENSDINSLKILINYIIDNEHYSYSNLRFYNTHDIWTYYNRNIVLSLLNYAIGDYINAYKYINEYISNNELSGKEKNFFLCVESLMLGKYKMIDESFIERAFGKNMCIYCKKFLENKNFLQYLKHSKCCDCSQCSISAYCKAIDILKIAKKMEYEYINNLPDQNKIIDLCG